MPGIVTDVQKYTEFGTLGKVNTKFVCAVMLVFGGCL